LLSALLKSRRMTSINILLNFTQVFGTIEK
jgi:hypothetical protein